MTRRLRVCRLATVQVTFATLLPAQIQLIVNAGIDLTLVSSAGEHFTPFFDDPSLHCYTLQVSRKIDYLHDLPSLFRLIHFFRREKFNIVHSSTPKAGLLTALAGKLAGVPIRIHTYTGQVWVEMKGPARKFMCSVDWLIGVLNTHTYADSFSQREFLIRERIVDSRKITVLEYGSISGVDLTRFDPVKLAPYRALIRRQLGISERALIIVFVGRVTRDKGVVELLEAFEQLCRKYNDLHLVFVGPLESERDPLPKKILDVIPGNAIIHFIGFTSQPETYLAAADIFCLPSYREGFGSVVIEAAAMNLPSVATTVTGLVDAVVDNETGLLVPPKDSKALAEALAVLIDSPDTRYRMGHAARQRALSQFDAAKVNQAMVDEYFRLAQW